jgi:HlyD family secretion protein
MKRKRIVQLVIAAVAATVIVISAVLHFRPFVLTGIVTTDEVVVSSEVQGRLQELKVRQGDLVKRGQLLALIEPAEWRADLAFYENSAHAATAQVAQAEADLRLQEEMTRQQIAQAEANLAAAQAQVAQADADLEIEKLTFQRADSLRKKEANSEQDFDQARTSYDAAVAKSVSMRKQAAAADAALALAKAGTEQVAARRAALAASRQQLAAAEAQREKASVRAGYTEIRAPINGVVDVRAALQGEVVNPGQAIVTLIDPDDLWVRADIEETYVDRIHLGDTLAVRLPSGAVREGRVFFRGIDADYATQRDVSRTKRDIKTFEFRLRCDNRDRALAVGMTAYIVLPFRP